VARKIIAEGARMGAPRKVIKIALATALVEANLENPRYGDRDSLGAFQQRPSQGWGSASQVTDVQHAAHSFYQRAIPLFKSGTKGGALAQAVQRSAFPGRYGEKLAQAGQILTKLEGSVGGLSGGTAQLAKGGGGPMPKVPTSRLVSQAVAPPPPLHDLPTRSVQPNYPTTSKPMAAAVQPGQPRSVSSQLQGTSPSSGAQTPFQGRTQTVREPIPAAERQALKAALAQAGQKQKPQPQEAGVGGAPMGKVRVASGADRAGVSTNKAVLRFVREISGLAGQPLTIGTGTNHSRMTTSGNVSDHWSGHAADIPASGQALTRLGRLALIAAGANRKWAKRQSGGLFNINGHQIIFNTNEGGNHYNHLHVSAY
jgi:hypothetical protein